MPAPAAQCGAAYRNTPRGIHRAAFAFEEEESGDEKGHFIILAAVLALVCAAALAENTTLTAVELNVDSLEYVDESRCLIARDADTRLYGLYSTAGEAMIPCEYGLLADAGYGLLSRPSTTMASTATPSCGRAERRSPAGNTPPLRC